MSINLALPNPNHFTQDGSPDLYICDGTQCGYRGESYCSNCGFEAGVR